MEDYGIYDWLRSINQMLLKDQKAYWMACGINIMLNLYPDIIWNESEFEHFYENEYSENWIKKPILNSWVSWIAWGKRVLAYMKEKKKKWVSLRRVMFKDDNFYKYIDEWRLIAVNINMNGWIKYELQNQHIKWPFQTPFPSTHWILLWKDNVWLFLLNSWYPETNKVRVDSLDIPWLFKWWEWYTFIPQNFYLQNNR